MATTTKTPEQVAQEQAAAQAKLAAKIAENKAKSAAKLQNNTTGTSVTTPAAPVAGAPVVDTPATNVTPAPTNVPFTGTVSDGTNTVTQDNGLTLTTSYTEEQKKKHAGEIPNVPSTAIPPTPKPTDTPESVGGQLATEVKTNIASDKAGATDAAAALKQREADLKAVADTEAANKERQAAAQTAEYQRQIAEQNAFDTKYNAEKQRQIDSMVSTVQPLKDAEVAANKAAIDKANADQESALSQAAIDTEAAQIQANYTYGKL